MALTGLTICLYTRTMVVAILRLVSLVLTFFSDEYFDDLGVAYRAEIKELYELGCRE